MEIEALVCCVPTSPTLLGCFITQGKLSSLHAWNDAGNNMYPSHRGAAQAD